MNLYHELIISADNVVARRVLIISVDPKEIRFFDIGRIRDVIAISVMILLVICI